MSFRIIPNVITVLRFLLVVPLIVFLHRENYSAAFWIFIIAGLSDGLDGLLAKGFNWVSRFGAIADPLADKVLLVSCFFMFAMQGHIGWWLFVLVMLRDVVIVAGAYWFHRAIGPYRMAPSVISKFNTVMQIFLVFVLLLSLSYLPLPGWFEQLVIWTVVATSVASGAHYVWHWGGKARLILAERRANERKSSTGKSAGNGESAA